MRLERPISFETKEYKIPSPSSRQKPMNNLANVTIIRLFATLFPRCVQYVSAWLVGRQSVDWRFNYWMNPAAPCNAYFLKWRSRSFNVSQLTLGIWAANDLIAVSLSFLVLCSDQSTHNRMSIQHFKMMSQTHKKKHQYLKGRQMYSNFFQRAWLWSCEPWWPVKDFTSFSCLGHAIQVIWWRNLEDWEEKF